MRSKLPVRTQVLTFRTQPNAICEYRFEAIKIASLDVDMAIHDHASQMLPDAPAHDPSLSVIRAEALFDQDRRDVCREALNAPLEFRNA